MWKLAGKFAKTVIPGVIKPLHVLWNEMIAFIFFAFTVVASFSAYRYYRASETDPDSFVRFLVAAVFALIMGCFAFGSYRRARKIAKR
jgi:uncharacterized membrane protein